MLRVHLTRKEKVVVKPTSNHPREGMALSIYLDEVTSMEGMAMVMATRMPKSGQQRSRSGGGQVDIRHYSRSHTHQLASPRVLFLPCILQISTLKDPSRKNNHPFLLTLYDQYLGTFVYIF